MDTEPKPPNKPIKVIIWISLSVTILLTAIYVFRGVLIAPYAITFLERAVSTNLGLQVTIGQLHGSYFSNIRINNVKTEKRITDGPFADLEVRNVNVAYHLFDLFKGLPAFLAGISIDLDGGLLAIDLTNMTASDDEEKDWPDLQLPPRLPQVRVSNSSVQVKGVGYETQFKGISLMSRHEGLSASGIKLHVSDWYLRHPDLHDIAANLDADIIYSDTRLTLANFAVGKQTLVESIAIDLREFPDRMPFQALLNPAGGRLEASGGLDTNRFRVQLSGFEIDLTQISGLLASDVAHFGGILSVHGNVDLPLKEPTKIETAMDVQISGGNLNDKIAEKLAFKFTSKNGTLEIADLKLENDTNRVSISKASVPAEVVFDADGDAILQSLLVNWHLECSNIPSLLKLVGLTFEERDELIPYHKLMLSGKMEKGDVLIPTGSLETDNGHVRLKTARITLPIGKRALIDSPLAADLQVDLPNVEILSQIFALPSLGGSIEGHIQVSGTLKAPLGMAKFNGDALTYQNIAIGNLSMLAEADVQRVAIETLTIERGKNRATGRGTINWMEKSFKDVHVELDVVDLSPYFTDVIPLFWQTSVIPTQVQGKLKGTIKLSGTFTKPEGNLNLHAQQVRIDGTSFGDADVDLKLSDGVVTVSSAVFRNLDDRLQIRGSIHHRLKRLDGVTMKVEIADLSAYTSPWLQADTPVSGSLKGHLHASGDLMNPDAKAELQVEQLRLNTIQIDSGFAKLKSANRLLSIKSAEIKTAEGTLQIAGHIQRNVDDTEFDITLETAAIIRQGTLLALERSAKCRLFRNGRIIFDDLALAGSAGRVSIDGIFDPNGESDLLITVADLQSDGWIDMIASDRIRFQGLNVRAKISGRSNAPYFAIDGSLDNLGSPNIPMAFSGQFKVEYGNRLLKLHEFAWSGRKGQQIHLTGALPLVPFHSNIFAPGQIALTGRARISDTSVLDFVIPWAEETGGSIQCDLKLAGTWARPSGELHLEIKDLQRPGSIKPLPPGPYTVTGDVRIDGDLVSLELIEAYSSGWKVRAKGQWSGAPSPVNLLRSEKPKLTGQVNLESSLTVSDLRWLAREVSGIRRLSGGLEARGVLRGPIKAPTADATIKLADAELSPDFDMPSLRKLNMETAVTPEAVTVQKFTGELGGAPFELAGTFKIATGSDSEADFRIQGDNILLYRDESVRLRADTDLTLKGPLAKMELAGEVAVTDGGFFKNFGVIEGFGAVGKSNTGTGFQLFSIRKPPLRDMRFNVRITAKEPFLVRNNLVRGSVRPDLTLTGTGEVPLLVGKVYVEPTRLYLPAGRMNLQAGLVRFQKTDPDRPKLDLVGTSTMRGYDITAVIDGPYDEPVITLSSVPPLPNEELLMLLLTGQPPKSSGTRSSGKNQSLNVAMFLGRDLLSRLFGGDSEESAEAIMDRFDVEVGRSITQRGDETIHSQFRLADDFLVDGDSLYLTGERDYFDFYNGGIKFVFRFR
jgi:autotransporter translocation and assembly factor TamB